MQIINKEDLNRLLKKSISKKIYLHIQDYILNVYMYGDFYYFHQAIEQTNNLTQDYVVELDLTDEKIKDLKKYLGLKSSRVEIIPNAIKLCKVKQNKNDPVPIIVENSELEIQVKSSELPYKFILEDYVEIKRELPENKIKTKFQFEAINLDNIFVNSNILPIAQKLMNQCYNNKYYTKHHILCLDDGISKLYVKCLEKIS